MARRVLSLSFARARAPIFIHKTNERQILIHISFVAALNLKLNTLFDWHEYKLFLRCVRVRYPSDINMLMGKHAKLAEHLAVARPREPICIIDDELVAVASTQCALALGNSALTCAQPHKE